jgi:hypothetical protein
VTGRGYRRGVPCPGPRRPPRGPPRRPTRAWAPRGRVGTRDGRRYASLVRWLYPSRGARRGAPRGRRGKRRRERRPSDPPSGSRCELSRAACDGGPRAWVCAGAHRGTTTSSRKSVTCSRRRSRRFSFSQVEKAAWCAMGPQLVAATAPPPSRWTPRAMAAMSFSVPARVGNARGALSSRRAASAARAPRVRPARPARQGLKVEATVSKDNVFAKNPGSLEALNNLTVDSARAGSPPLTSASAPDDFSTMPHKERLKVFSGSAHPELSDVRALFQTSDSRFFRKTRRGDSGPAGARRRERVARGDARARTGGTSRSIARPPVPPRARVAARSSADPFSWSNASVQKFGIPPCLEMGVRRSELGRATCAADADRVSPFVILRTLHPLASGNRQLPRHGSRRSRD